MNDKNFLSSSRAHTPQNFYEQYSNEGEEYYGKGDCDHDEVTFLLRLRPPASPPNVRKYRRDSADLIPLRIDNNASNTCGWDVIVERGYSPVPPPLPPRSIQPSAPPAPIIGKPLFGKHRNRLLLKIIYNILFDELLLKLHYSNPIYSLKL